MEESITYVVSVAFFIQSMYMIWIRMAYNNGICKRCGTGTYLPHDVTEGGSCEDAEDAMTNVQCSCCGYKTFIPNKAVANGRIPTKAFGIWWALAIGFVMVIYSRTNGN